MSDPRECDARDRVDERPRVYDERDRDDHDPRDGLMHDLDLPRGDERELVVERRTSPAASATSSCERIADRNLCPLRERLNNSSRRCRKSVGGQRHVKGKADTAVAQTESDD
jgi:hypothetical protein